MKVDNIVKNKENGAIGKIITIRENGNIDVEYITNNIEIINEKDTMRLVGYYNCERECFELYHGDLTEYKKEKMEVLSIFDLGVEL